MAKADYETDPIGHFGLALDDYSHFTSPIRRYPDLAIHRILSADICGEKLENTMQFAKTAAIAGTMTEQRAVQTERDCEDCLGKLCIGAHRNIFRVQGLCRSHGIQRRLVIGRSIPQCRLGESKGVHGSLHARRTVNEAVEALR